MENSKGVLIRRSREGRKKTATAMDMVQDRVNKDTRDTEAVVFVQDEKSRTVKTTYYHHNSKSRGCVPVYIPHRYSYSKSCV